MNTELWTPRVTVAAVIEQDNRFLVVKETTEQRIVINQPAGHLEDGERLVDAVKREVLEETARLFKPEGLVGVYRWRVPKLRYTYMRFCFHGSCSERDPTRTLDDGIIRTLWLSREELAASDLLRSPLVLACIDDYLTRHSFSLDLLRD